MKRGDQVPHPVREVKQALQALESFRTRMNAELDTLTAQLQRALVHAKASEVDAKDGRLDIGSRGHRPSQTRDLLHERAPRRNP